ncbi:MAG TPA: hypothetical protein VFJ97_08620 [Dermatophilaceae bacterium]|nr:hypothetical protein [Dermatophilaceae bacterium]
MSLAAVLVPLAAGAEKVPNPLPMPVIWFGILSILAFAALLAITWSFRNTGAKADQAKARRDGTGASMGAGTGGHH